MSVEAQGWQVAADGKVLLIAEESDLAIDYSIQPVPPVSEGEFEWLQTLPQI